MARSANVSVLDDFLCERLGSVGELEEDDVSPESLIQVNASSPGSVCV
jgi:hypothetical protein